MNDVLRVMWVSCFWFLMPGAFVTTRPGCPQRRRRGPTSRREPARAEAVRTQHGDLRASEEAGSRRGRPAPVDPPNTDRAIGRGPHRGP